MQQNPEAHKYQPGQAGQPVSSGPQYITNIYNTINTNSITTHQDQIYQFVGPQDMAQQLMHNNNQPPSGAAAHSAAG